MKKSLFVMAAGLLALVACGPSAEEQAKMEQARQDSINAVVEQARLDSVAEAERIMQESLDVAQKATEDSLKMKAMEDSLASLKAAANKPKPKTKPKPAPQPTKPEEVKPGQGRG